MTQKEIGEIRRHTRRDRSNITTLYGCFVKDDKEIISQFKQSLGTMPENEAFHFFTYLSKNLSGTPGKHLIDIPFTTEQVSSSPAHKRLMDLRETRLENDEIRQELFDAIVQSYPSETSYLILVGCDSYDIPHKTKDDLADSEEERQVYRYILCCICPVKSSKPGIEYKPPEKEFHFGEIMQLLTAPVLGFLFPTFDNRATNIYSALLYSKKPDENHEDFVGAVFDSPAFVPADAQKSTFDDLLSSTLGDECNIEVIQKLYDEIDTKILLHKEMKENEPLTIGKEDVMLILTASGVSDSGISAFCNGYDAAFGLGTRLPPKNIIAHKQFEVKTEDVAIRVNPDRSDLVTTKIIDGVKCIVICADENVTVNGVRVQIGNSPEKGE